MTDTSPEIEQDVPLESEIVQSVIAQANEIIKSIGESTATFYQARIRRLIQKVHDQIAIETQETEDPENSSVIPQEIVISPVTLIERLVEMKVEKDWKPSTWRITKSSLAFHFAQTITDKHEHDDAKKMQYVFALHQLQNYTEVGLRGYQKSINKQSRSDQPHITPSELDKIVIKLMSARKNSFWPEFTIYFMMAGLVSGLRPIEWETACWNDSTRTDLQVKTAKKKIDPERLQRALAAYRAKNGIGTAKVSSPVSLPMMGVSEDLFTFDSDLEIVNEDADHIYRLVPIDPIDRAWVDAHLANLGQYMDAGGKFSAYFDACRIRLHSAVRSLFKGERSISLYTMRHQFAANSRVLRGREETMKIMGNSARALQAYSGAKVAHQSVRDRASGIGAVLTAQDRAAQAFINRKKIVGQTSPLGQVLNEGAQGDGEGTNAASSGD